MVDRLGGGVLITVIILTLLVIGIVVAWVVSRRRRAAALRNREEIPLFTIPASQIPGLPRPSTATGRFATPTSSYEPPPVRSSPVDRDSRLAASAATVRTREGAVSAAARPARSETPVSIDDEMGEVAFVFRER